MNFEFLQRNMKIQNWNWWAKYEFWIHTKEHENSEIDENRGCNSMTSILSKGEEDWYGVFWF